MTDSQNESLPVGARWQEITLRNGEDASDIFVNSEEVERFNDEDVFYRGKDVKALIQDKIEHVEINPKDEEIAIEQSKVLQELLDELEGEASK